MENRIQLYRAGPLGQKVSIVYWGTISSRACWSGVPPFQERREDVCAQSTVKTRSKKNIELVRSNGHVTDTSSRASKR